MKKPLLVIGVTILTLFVLVKIVLSFGFVWDYLPFDHSPSGDICKIDADCICRQPCCDQCGEMGDAWFCMENRCRLVPRKDL
jgi:hypothetical protein